MYRIKHLPSGLYFIPVRTVRVKGTGCDYTKSNLSKTGKVYHRKPNLDTFIETVRNYYTPLIPGRDMLMPIVAHEWEIESLPQEEKAFIVIPRRPFDKEKPDGYMESDRDFVLNNLDAAVTLLEQYAAKSKRSVR